MKMEVKLSSSNWDALQMETNKNLVFEAMKVHLFRIYTVLSVFIKRSLILACLLGV